MHHISLGSLIGASRAWRWFSRLRKKGISAACSLTLVSPGGREVKESGHPFGCAQDKLLPRVRNVNIFIDRGKVFFRTLLGMIKARSSMLSFNDIYRMLMYIETFMVPILLILWIWQERKVVRPIAGREAAAAAH